MSTRRSWLTGVTAGALAPAFQQLRASTCPRPGLAPRKLFPQFLWSAYAAAARPNLFNSPGCDDLPPAVITPSNIVRIPVDQIGRPENAPALNLLRTAYEKMRNDSTVCGFVLQASLHNLYCFGGGAHNHDGGVFLAWHRALLYYHERLLRKNLEQAGVAGAAQVALPYWDVLSFSEGPGVYGDDPELDHPDCRTWIVPDTATSSQAAGQLSLGLAATDLMNCSRYLFSWHLAVHCYVGGDMQTLQNAAFDPIFFALHSAVDCMWTNSKAASIAPASNTCAFYDAYAGGTGAWVRVDLKDFSAGANLGIAYAPPSGVAAWITRLAPPAAVEIQLPERIGEGVKLYVQVRERGFNLGEILTMYGHSDRRMASRFAVSGPLERLLRTVPHDSVRFLLQADKSAPIMVPGKWRLIRAGH